MRTVLGFLVAPLVAPVLFAVAALLFGGSTLDARFVAGYGIWVGYIVIAGLGIPTYLVLRLLRWRSLAAYAVVAFVLGVLAFEFLWMAPLTPLWVLLKDWYIAAFCGLSGAIAGAAFWIIARPDTRSRESLTAAR